MNHSDIQSRMASYLDGELSLEKRALFDAHLDSCDACSAELMEMRETIRLLRNLPSPEPPPDLVAHVMQRIEEGEGQPSWLGQLADRLHTIFVPRFAIPATAAAAALTLTVIAGEFDLQGMNARERAPAQFAASTPDPMAIVSRAPGSTLPVRGARSSTPATNARPEPVFVANSLPPLQPDDSGVGSFLRRVSGDPLGPIRRDASSLDARSPIFLMSDTPYRGPYLGASAAPSIALGTGAFRGAGQPRLQPVVVSRLDSVPAVGTAAVSLEERRRRELDIRLEALIQDPPGFAEMQARVTPAEQDLWLRELAAHAEEIGEVDRVLSALKGSGDAGSLRLATEFASAVERNRAAWASADRDQP